MSNEENIEKMAVEAYGRDIQEIVCIEELSELIQALCKEMRPQRRNDKYWHKHDVLSIAEELSDVEVMLAQIKYIFDNETYSGVLFSDLVEKMVIMKKEVLRKRILYSKLDEINNIEMGGE